MVNLQEYFLGTNPKVTDSDGDGIADGVEVAQGSSPLDASDPAGVAGKAALILPVAYSIHPGDTSAVPLHLTSGSSISSVRFNVSYDTTLLAFRNFRLADSLVNFHVDSLVSSPLGGSGKSILVQFSSPLTSFSGMNKLVAFLTFAASSQETTAVITFDTSRSHWKVIDQNNFPVKVASFTNSTVRVGFLTSVKDDRARGQVPRQFALYQNYPNPFNPSTTIRFDLPVASHVSIRIYNILGQEVKALLDGIYGAGSYSQIWDGRNSNGVSVATGIYFYRIETTGAADPAKRFAQVKKMMVLR